MCLFVDQGLFLKPSHGLIKNKFFSVIRLSGLIISIEILQWQEFSLIKGLQKGGNIQGQSFLALAEVVDDHRRR